MTGISPTSSQQHSLNPGEKMVFRNGGSSLVRIRVVMQCGTETEAELHPGAVFNLTVGTASATVDILPPEAEYTGIKGVD